MLKTLQDIEDWLESIQLHIKSAPVGAEVLPKIDGKQRRFKLEDVDPGAILAFKEKYSLPDKSTDWGNQTQLTVVHANLLALDFDYPFLKTEEELKVASNKARLKNSPKFIKQHKHRLIWRNKSST